MNVDTSDTKHSGRRCKSWPLAGLLSVFACPLWAAGVPVYPGAVVDPVASAAAKHAGVYLSRDTLAQVRSWYQARLGNRSASACSVPDSGCGRFKQDCETATGGDARVRCSDLLVLKWNAIPAGGSMVDAYNAGVHLHGWKVAPEVASGTGPTTAPQQPAAGSAGANMAKLDAMMKKMQAMAQQETQRIDAESERTAGVNPERLGSIPDMPFKGLKQEVMAGRHSQQELDAVYKKYRWLARAVYPLQRTPQGGQSYEHWLVNRTWARMQASRAPADQAASGAAEDAAAEGKRMQQLVAAGRMQEAKQLARQLVSGMQAGQQAGGTYLTTQRKDHWNEWIDVIRQLAAHAYRTKIVIDRF